VKLGFVKFNIWEIGECIIEEKRMYLSIHLE